MITPHTAERVRGAMPASKVALTKRKNGRNGFDPESFLTTAGVGRTLMNVEKKQALFTQGDPADAIFYIQKGKVRLSVVSEAVRRRPLPC